MVLAADVDSSDNSGELLRKELGERNVISFDGRKGGYGAAVNAVLEHQSRTKTGQLVGALTGSSASNDAGPSATPPSATASSATATSGPAVSPDSAAQEWIWLLQDDAAPAPDALEKLLESVERSTTATVVGCKQLAWDAPRRLVDVGLKANKWFDRFTMVNLDELDQGQYDHRSDFFAVNAAGMLVRRDVWEKLGGFDPALPGPGDDIDFCARVRLAGHRVLVVPGARMFHVVNRANALGSPSAARKAAIFIRLKHAPLWQVPLLIVGAVLSAVYWLFAGFLLKAPGHAVAMFAATFAGVMRPVALANSRASLAKTRVQPRSAHKGLMAGREESLNQLKSLREAVGPDDDSGDLDAAMPSILEPTGDAHNEAVTPLVTGKTAPIVSGLALALVLALLAVVTLSRFLGAPALTGGALLPLSEHIGSLWRHATDWWISLGSGLPGRGEPFNYILFLLAALGFGDGSTAVLWLVVLAVPLSGLTAWLAAGAFTAKRWPRVIAGLIWAGAPVLQTALGQGRLGALLAHVLIPLVILGLVRAVGGAVGAKGGAAPKKGPQASPTVKLGRPGVDGNPSWTAAAGAGLALAALTVAAPSLLPLAFIAILAATVALRRRGKTLWWALVPSAALYLPFVYSALSNPRALLGDPGVPLAGAAGPLWQQLLGFPELIAPASNLLGTYAIATDPLWTWVAVLVIGVPVVLVAFLALLAPLRRAGTVRTLWLVAVLALAVAYGSKLLAVALQGETLVTAFNGPAVSVALFALLGAALLGFDAVYRTAYDARDLPRTGSGNSEVSGVSRGHRGARLSAVVLSVVLVAGPVASLGLWSANSLSGNSAGLTGSVLVNPLTAGSIPATAADRGTGPEASRTIVLRVLPDAGVQATLMQGSGTVLDTLSSLASAERITGAPGAQTLKDTDPATSMLRESVAAMMAKTGIDPRPELTQLGVGFVVLENGDTAAELVAGELEAVPGLDTVGPTSSGWLWRVKPSYQDAGTTDVVTRVRVVDAQGAPLLPLPSNGQDVNTVVPAGQQGRRVVLAERFDPGWSAWLNGEELQGSKDGWAQSFELPATAGTLDIRYVQPWNTVMSLVQMVLLGLTVLLAIPLRARRGRTGSYRDEASLQKVGRGV
ncbi:glycosyltransferase family 2 protein [Arthrobacter alpinus]|uniref:glycosyltransferase family 2 protein n=1 Tax=Arthrobacter alpinus TaxID=656366 RepID=UPI0007818AEC|nr:glycosyltransferase [Arthrobacter alpinus]